MRRLAPCGPCMLCYAYIINRPYLTKKVCICIVLRPVFKFYTAPEAAMDKKLLEYLSVMTAEEEAILNGNKKVDRSLYYSSEPARRSIDEVDAARVLQNGKIIDIRRHVRYVHFPRHTHNFVEFIYMCRGTTTHIIDGNTITLETGDLLFLNQHAAQEILPAGEEDIAVNFMILPRFFDTAFKMLGNEQSALRRFIISCLTEQNMGGNYLYFHVSDIAEVQNLMENLILIMLSDDERFRRTLSETTMGLLFMHLVNTADRIAVSQNSYEEELMIRLLNKVDSEYRSVTLEGFCEENKVDLYFMGRLIKRCTGKTFRTLLQEKRLEQACYLLKNTTLPVTDVAGLIGYSNNSFFHRLFRREIGMSPREYRMDNADGRA